MIYKNRYLNQSSNLIPNLLKITLQKLKITKSLNFNYSKL